MSLPWSSKGLKATPVNADEIMLIDSADANPATQNKRATLGSLPDVGEVNTTSNVGTGEGLALTKVGFDFPFRSLLGETNKIVLTGNVNDVTFTLGTLTVTTDKTNTFGDFAQIFPDNQLFIQNPAATFEYQIIADAIASDLTLTFPLLTTNDIFVTEAFAQTLTNKTLAAGSNTITGLTNTNLTSGVFSNITGVGTQSQALDMGTTNKIVNLAEPTLAQDSATKNYVDSFVQGTVKWKEPVIVATTGSDITLSGEQTIDGILTSTDRILVKDQTLGEENGIYVTDAGAWSRATDFDAADEILNAAMWVSEGTANADQAFVCTTDLPIVVGTTVLTFVQFSGLGQITAGTNLSKTANTLDFDPTGGVDMLANNFINVGLLNLKIDDTTAILELEAKHTTPAANQVIGRHQFYDDDDLNARRLYAEINSEIEDPANLSLDGSLFFRVVENNGLATYMTLNNSGLGTVSILKPLNMGAFEIQQLNTISWQAGHSIVGTGSFLTANVGSGDFFVVNVNGTNEWFFGASMDAGENDIENFRALEFFASSTLPTSGVTYIQDNLGVLTTNVGLGESLLWTANAVNLMTLSLTGIDILAKFMDIGEITTPADPSANVARLYARDDAAITKLFFRDSAGTETELGGGGSENSISQLNTNITVTDTGSDGLATFAIDGTDKMFMDVVRTRMNTTRFEMAQASTDSNISSNVVTLNNEGNYFEFNNTVANLDGISNTGWQAGSIIYLRMRDADGTGVTFRHNQTVTPPIEPLILIGGLDFTITNADDEQIVPFMFDGSVWIQLARPIGGAEVFQWTAAHNAAGFNLEFKVATPITMGQGATDLLSITFLDDVVDAGVLIGNTDGFISFRNRSAVVGDNQMELLMESGGATTIQNVMRFQIPVAEDSGTAGALRMDFVDDAGGTLVRPMLELTTATNQMLELILSGGRFEWNFHVSTDLNDMGSINSAGVTTTFAADRFINMAAEDELTWQGAAVGTPNFIKFTDSDIFQVYINDALQFQVTDTTANFLSGTLQGVIGLEFQGSTADVVGTSSDLELNGPTNVAIHIADVLKYSFDTSFLDMKGLNIRNLSAIRGDLSGTNEILTFSEVASALNEVNITNAISGVGPTISAQGTNTDIDLNLASKGTGAISLNDYTIADTNIQQIKGPDIVATANLAPREGNFFDVTGSTQIDFLVDDLFFQAGSIITLQFDAAVTLQHNAAAPPTNFSVMLLKGDVDFIAAAGDLITFVFDGLSWLELSRASAVTPGLSIVDATDIVLGTTTGTKIGTATTQKLGFYNATPIVQPTALTAPETTLTNAGTASDFAIQAMINASAWGFATQAEGETVVEVVLNNQARIDEIETKLQALGLLA